MVVTACKTFFRINWQMWANRLNLHLNICWRRLNFTLSDFAETLITLAFASSKSTQFLNVFHITYIFHALGMFRIVS